MESASRDKHEFRAGNLLPNTLNHTCGRGAEIASFSWVDLDLLNFQLGRLGDSFMDELDLVRGMPEFSSWITKFS